MKKYMVKKVLLFLIVTIAACGSLYSQDDSVKVQNKVTDTVKVVTKVKGNSSYRPSNSGSGSVSVKGYYRKDGTYVKPHTRKSPKRKK
ncbi:MAG: hypothetical protein LBG17_10235 [Bacteroidales bacterium]|jgi:hypothetical protein|nr:hypothetical protein [Bacteroidales bacterium]